MRIACELEFRRQMLHLVSGVMVVVLLYFDIINVFFILLIFLLGITLSIISKRRKIPFIYWVLKNFDRSDHIKSFPGKGPLFMILGILLTLIFFKKDVALASIMILSLGDSISHIVGRYFGRIKHPLSKVKLLEGSIVGTIAAFLGALIFVNALEAFFASLIAMTFEAYDLMVKKHFLDDNLVIPLLSGTVISVMRSI